MKPFLKIFLLAAIALNAAAQSPYQFDITKTTASCVKASASLQISGTDPSDTISINWSTAQADVYIINNLNDGNYFVHVQIKNKADTTISFSIAKEECPVGIGNLLTPNGDGYNDVLSILHVEKYPNFELEVFNKWGQRVHAQRSNYIPWDGKGNNIEVPDGTYYFVFFYDASDKSKLVKGDVTILH